MPKQSRLGKYTTTSTAPSAAHHMYARDVTKIYCPRCGIGYPKQQGSFFISQSTLYKYNGRYHVVCKHCMEEIFEHYKSVLNDEKEAMYRICMKFDIYWSEKVYKSLDTSGKKNAGVSTRLSRYIHKTNLVPNLEKTFDNSLDESEIAQYAEDQRKKIALCDAKGDDVDEMSVEEIDDVSLEIPKDWIDFWGAEFEPAFYYELQRRYDEWASAYDEMSVSDRAVIKQICITEATINRDSALGKPIDKLQSSLNSLLGSANLKPVQVKKVGGTEAGLEAMPFGVGIARFENTRPIPKPDPDFEDVDKIHTYINAWYAGHMAKMLGLKVDISEAEREIAKYTVTKPEYNEEEASDTAYEKIFGKSEGGDVK